MNGVTFDEVGSKPKASSKASKEDNSPSQENVPKAPENVPKVPNAIVRALGKAAGSPRIWATITCALLAISCGERYWRDGDFWGRIATARESPFPLVEMPKELGSWQMVEGSEATLDPDIASAAGASSNLIRSYTDSKSGENVTVLILYGLARGMIGHSPDYCYPYSGFEKVDNMGEFDLELSDLKKVVRYRGGNFTKVSLGATQYVQVIYTLRSGDDWLTNATMLWANARVRPGMYKIQIAGPAAADLAVDKTPSVGLLADIVKEIEKRLSQAESKSKKAAAAKPATPKSN